MEVVVGRLGGAPEGWMEGARFAYTNPFSFAKPDPTSRLWVATIRYVSCIVGLCCDDLACVGIY